MRRKVESNRSLDGQPRIAVWKQEGWSKKQVEKSRRESAKRRKSSEYSGLRLARVGGVMDLLIIRTEPRGNQ